MKRLGLLMIVAMLLWLSSAASVAQSAPSVLEAIRAEGMERSQVMQHLAYLTDVIGPRLTGSPSLRRANEWTRDTMAKWGLAARLEPWGPFGRGWSLVRYSAQLVTPNIAPVVSYPKAWTTSTSGPVTADVIFVDAETDADLEKYRGLLRGKIVLMSKPRDLGADFGGMASRLSAEQLARLAAAPDPASVPPRPLIDADGRPSAEMMALLRAAGRDLRILRFAASEGAAVVAENSPRGSGGTLMVSPAIVLPDPAPVAPGQPRPASTPWSKSAESRIPVQITIATEDYNRLVRLSQLGVQARMTVDVATQFHDEDAMAYNTIAEIPGTDAARAPELVMLGAHLDSWHSGGGATDNAAGSAVVMEAVRILTAIGVKPRRTIRVALWTGEEQGLLGSKAYAAAHFGELRNNPAAAPDVNGQRRELVKGADYEKLSAYFNLDNGTGKIRGVYLQGNVAVRPIFGEWLQPFANLDATTLSLSSVAGTDHLAFDQIGLPGFQFIQDPIEYETRTHHTNQDTLDRIQADDLKQAATIMATFIYQAAMRDGKLPRKPAASAR